MAGLASSTVQRASKPPRQSQPSSDEMAETLRAWDDEEDEVVEFMQGKKDGSRQNTNGSSSLPSVGASRPVTRYSPSTVRCAKTLCLYTSFFGLGMCVAIIGPTLLELQCHTGAKLEQMSFAFTSRSIGYLIGSMIGGWLYDKYNGHIVLAVSCLWGTLMMLVLPYVTSIYGLVIVIGLLGIGLGSLDTGGNVLLLNTWRKKSRPYMQGLHFLFALGAFVAPLIVQPFLQDSCHPLECTQSSNGVNRSTSIDAGNARNNCMSNNNSTSDETIPVTWAYWIGCSPLAITGIGFLIFVLNKSCSPQESEIQEEEPSKVKHGSLIYRIIILSLFSMFLLLYVGFEVAYGGYIFTFGRTVEHAMDKDSAAFLTSAFWGSFALARLASVPISKYLRPTHMLSIDMAGFLLGSIVLLSQLKDGDCKASDSTKLWVGTVVLGMSMASVFPSSINWAEYFVNVSGRTASILLVASSCGEMLVPFAVGNTIGEIVGPCALMACAMVISVLVLVIFLMILCAGRHFKQNSAYVGMLYQRNQKQEEERTQRQPADEVLELLQQNNELFKNGDGEMTM